MCCPCQCAPLPQHTEREHNNTPGNIHNWPTRERTTNQPTNQAPKQEPKQATCRLARQLRVMECNLAELQESGKLLGNTERHARLRHQVQQKNHRQTDRQTDRQTETCVGQWVNAPIEGAVCVAMPVVPARLSVSAVFSDDANNSTEELPPSSTNGRFVISTSLLCQHCTRCTLCMHALVHAFSCRFLFVLSNTTCIPTKHQTASSQPQLLCKNGTTKSMNTFPTRR